MTGQEARDEPVKGRENNPQNSATRQEARDDEREAMRSDIADEISGVEVGSGYESTTIGIHAALEAADLLIAAGYRQHPEPEWHDRDRDGICRRCGSGMTARDIVDGEQPCNARTHPEPEITDEMVERAVRATWEPSAYLNADQNDARRSTYAADIRRVLEAALRVPVGEGDLGVE